MNKNKWVKPVIALLIVLIVCLLAFIIQVNSNKTSTKQSSNTIDRSQIYTIDGKVEVIDNVIQVEGSTNLPDGAIIDITANRTVLLNGDTQISGSSEGRGIEKATVSGGKFNTEVALNDEAFKEWKEAVGEEITEVDPTVEVSILFNPERENPTQPLNIIELIGSQGEALSNSPQLDQFGSQTNNPKNRLELHLETLLPLQN